MIKKRRPALAVILSFLAPGVGHIYAGNARKGFYLIGIEYGVIFLLGITGSLSTFAVGQGEWTRRPIVPDSHGMA